MLDRPHPVRAEEQRKSPLHDAPVGEHVRDAAGYAQVVFEHHELAALQAQQVGAGDRDVNIARHLQAAHLAAEVLTAVDDLARHKTLVQDLALVVDIVQEEIERRDPLRQSLLDMRPFLAGHDARQQIVGEDALRAFFPAIDGKSNALGQKRNIGGALAALQLVPGNAGQCIEQFLVLGANLSVLGEHLVKGMIEKILRQRRVFEMPRRP